MPKFSDKTCNKEYWAFLKVNVELLLLFLVEIIKIKKSVPGQTPPIFRWVQRLGGLIG
jgi:hypothetical protein